nr:MAG TPA: hypothetical protein [Caudoviricetes sp.]
MNYILIWLGLVAFAKSLLNIIVYTIYELIKIILSNIYFIK